MASWGIPLLVFCLAFWNRLSGLLRDAWLWAWKRGIDGGLPLHIEAGILVTPWGPSATDGDSGLCSPRPQAHLEGLAAPREVWDGGGLDRDHGCLDGDGTGPMVPRRTEGLVEGVRRMVATPGVTIAGPRVVGRPAVGGRALRNILRIGLADVAVSWDGGGFVKLLLISLLVTTSQRNTVI